MSFGGEGLFDVFSGESGSQTGVEVKANGDGKRKNDEPISKNVTFKLYFNDDL